MERLLSPFVRAYEYVGQNYGFPGYLFCGVATVLIVLGVIHFVSNHGK